MSLNEKELEKFRIFEKILKIKFNNPELLKRSLIHRSKLNESREPDIKSNERLEFLGDAVLELITTEYLFDKYPDRPEGELTSFRAALVRTESLAETALKLKYSDYIYMSKGEEATGGRTRPYILANTFEAVLGAIYLDQGYKVAHDFVNRELIPKIKTIVENRTDIDNKSKLQEVAQEMLKQTPSYDVIDTKGPDHEKEFTVEVLINDKRYGTGAGTSKQLAEQDAAKNALEEHFKDK